MEKKNARFGEKVINQTIINEIKNKFFPTIVGIDPGRVHMAAVVVEKFDYPEQEEPTESRNFFVEQLFYDHIAKQNIHRFRGQKFKRTNLKRWFPLSNKKGKICYNNAKKPGYHTPTAKHRPVDARPLKEKRKKNRREALGGMTGGEASALFRKLLCFETSRKYKLYKEI